MFYFFINNCILRNLSIIIKFLEVFHSTQLMLERDITFTILSFGIDSYLYDLNFSDKFMIY